jgi:eukaryotic-like serine/threonine-protein kinase
MPTNRACPECGAVLPADAPRGLCPRCLALAAAGELLGDVMGAPEAERPLVHYFGDYELLEEIARGGMGVVYRARQVSLNRPVAVKMILAGLFASEAERKRFRLEAETAARLTHPNIVEIYEVGEHQGQPYFSMRLVEGASLAKQAARALSIRDSVRIMVKTARAVHFAHQRGVLHRDLKPGNILLDRQGEPHITDFGLARLIEGGSDLTLSGALLGSPGYMPPEQASGKAKHLTTAADIYGLGAVLYFLLTGQAPFTGATPIETTRRVLDEEPPKPRRLNPHLDADLETICLKCLEKDPQRRYGSAEALADDLDRWLRYEPILARPSGTLHRLGKWVRREPRVAALVGVVAFSFAVGVGSVVYEWRQADAARRQAESERHAAEKHSARAEAAQRDATEKLRDSYLAQAHANRLTTEPGRRYRSLEILAKAAAIRPGPDLRDEAIACLPLIDVRNLRTVGSPAEVVTSSPPDEQWERYAVALRGGEISVRRLSDDRELARLPSAGAEVIEFPGFSHSGRWLAAYSRDGKCRVWDLEHRTNVLTGKMPYRRQALSFRKDDQELALADGERTVRIIDIRTSKVLRFLPNRDNSPCLAYSPDGRYLAVEEPEVSLKIYDADTGNMLADLVHPKPPQALAWHPDSRRIAVAAHDRVVRLWDALSGKELRALAGHGQELNGLAFHPAAELMLSSGYDGAMLWDTQAGIRLAVLPGDRYNPAFAPDGVRFYTKQQTLGGFELWEIAVDRPVRSLGSRQPLPNAKALTFGSDGGVLAFANGRDLVCLNPRTGRDLARTPWGEADALLWDASGQLWATALVWRSPQRTLQSCTLRSGTHPDERVLSPPEPRLSTEISGSAALTSDGKLLAVPYAESQCRIFEAATARELARTPGKLPITCCALSSDHHWLATGARGCDQIRIWEQIQGQTNLVQKILLSAKGTWGGRPQFSPDGSRLAVHWGINLTVYNTSDWSTVWVHPGEDYPVMAQALDGSLLALRNERNRIHLLAPKDGTVLATLVMPNDMGVEALAFSPDSRLLAAASSGVDQLFIWDLPGVRQELARLGLDWSAPPGPATAPARFETNTIASTQTGALEQENGMSVVPTWKPDPLKPPDKPQPKSEAAESNALSLATGRIPSRDPKTSPSLVDLGRYYNLALDEAAPSEAADNHLGNLPAGVHQFANVSFDVRGRLQLSSKRLVKSDLPVSSPAIKVALKCRRLHFLCAVAVGSLEGTRVATLLIRQQDHSEAEFGLVFGLNISDWWCGKKTEGSSGPVVAWTGTNATAQQARCHLHLYKATWENPHPDQMVDSVTFRSELEESSPFLLAITAE